MSAEHLPELGQMAFSNSAFFEYRVPELLEAALAHLHREIERVEWNRRQEEYPGPGAGGRPWTCDVFAMHPYCFCDGDRDGHADGCPANFAWRDLLLNWYKHLGRGMSMSRSVSPVEIAELLDECLAAVRATEAQLY